MKGFINGEVEEEDFYRRNIDNAVNLFMERGATISGDISKYFKDQYLVVLLNSIQRIYSQDGASKYIEDENDFELDTRTIIGKQRTSKEDRLGRIVKYNKELKIETLEQEAKLNKLENQPTNNHS